MWLTYLSIQQNETLLTGHLTSCNPGRKARPQLRLADPPAGAANARPDARGGIDRIRHRRHNRGHAHFAKAGGWPTGAFLSFLLL